VFEGNLALKLEDFEDSYCNLHLVEDCEQSLPDNIIQFPKAEKIEQDNVKFNRRSVAEISKDYVGQKVTYTLIWTKGDNVYQAQSDQIKIIEKGNNI